MREGLRQGDPYLWSIEVQDSTCVWSIISGRCVAPCNSFCLEFTELTFLCFLKVNVIFCNIQGRRIIADDVCNKVGLCELCPKKLHVITFFFFLCLSLNLYRTCQKHDSMSVLMPFIYNEKMDIYCSLSEYKWIYALACWGVQSCAQYFQSIMSSEGSHWKLLHYACLFVETDRHWYFSTSCDLFIEMKRRFSQSGPSLHIIESAPFEAYLECLRHTSSFSSSIFHLSVLLILCLQVPVIKLLSHLWSRTLFFCFVALISMPSWPSPRLQKQWPKSDLVTRVCPINPTFP